MTTTTELAGVEELIEGLAEQRRVVYIDGDGKLQTNTYRYGNNAEVPNLAAEMGLDPKRWTICEASMLSQQRSRVNHFGQPTAEELLEGSRKYLTATGSNRSYYVKQEGKVKRAKNCSIVGLQVRKVPYSRHARRSSYSFGYNHHQDDGFVCFATIIFNRQTYVIKADFSFFEEAFGAKINRDLTVECEDASGELFDRPIADIIGLMAGRIDRSSGYSYNNRDKGGFDYDIQGIASLSSHVHTKDKANTRNLLLGMLDAGIEPEELAAKGITKLYKKISGFADDLLRLEPEEAACFRSIVRNSNRSIKSVKVSTVFNTVFADVDSVESLREALKPFVEARDGNDRWSWFENCIENFDAFKDKRRETLAKQTDRAFSKLMEEYGSLGLDEKKFPKLTKAIKSGDIPVSTFFRKSEQYFLLNDNWELWEKMLKLDYEMTVRLAQEVSRRTTYEKDLMSYFYFILYDLPAYLKKHTGEKWTCSPKLIESESELNPPVEDDSGVARTRSALTPQVDNKAKHVVVPYASLAIAGRQVTYCYSHSYHVLRKGLMFNGNVCMDDLGRELNGRDDYGLMFYTLTGSVQGRGYPTFLIIFERHGSGETTVHFHRTHPSRSKDGDYNPIHNWIKVCYNWMAGNIRADKIKAQQGDLFFVETDKEDGFDRKVTDYDHHRFGKPVPFAEYTKKAKSNILGYVQLDRDHWLSHNEHDDEKIPAGTYEIRQCRSWEANPKGIWTLNID